MSRFLLIDNSITDTSGHYYQYAMFCLNAAKTLGLDPVLITNKEYEDHEKVPWKIIPTYRYGFWVRPDKPSRGIYGLVNQITNSIKKRRAIGKIRNKYSKLGYYQEIHRMLPTILANKTIETDETTISKKTLLFTGLFLGPPLYLYPYLKNKFKKFFNPKEIFEIQLFLRIGKTDPIDMITGNKLLKSRIETFATDTRDLLHKINLTEDDHVFIPTAGLTEMLGILEYFKNNPKILKANWHFLFRRNIMKGTRIHYFTQREQMRGLRNAFQVLLDGLKNEKVFFYTDTKELTEQYSELKIAKFTTLPIPHTHPEPSHKINHEKIIISYLGDARTEKGYHHLPAIIDDLWKKYVKTGKVIFKIQSNFNIPGGEPNPALAKNLLSVFPSDKVELISDPPSLKEYTDLLLSSNIILLPYERDNYYARSSGVLAEALAAGIPVLVPEGSWMSRQFQRKICEYHLSLRNELKMIRKFDSSSLRWYGIDFKQLNFAHNRVSFQEHDKRIFCDIRVPKESTHCLFSFDFSEDPLSSIVGGYINQFDSKLQKLASREFLLEKIDSFSKATLFIKLRNNAEKIVIELKNPESTYPVTISNFEVDFLTNPNKNKEIPLSVIGTTYRDYANITPMLSELIDNFPHYLKTAKEFSKEYYKFHNANMLVKMLLSNGKTDSE